MKRDRGYLRRERAKHIKRRKKLSKHYWYVEHDGYLDKGKIVENGNHEELMNNNKKYAQLVNHQNSLESIYNENLADKEVAVSE